MHVLRKVLFLLLFSPVISHAQYWEVGAFLGSSNYSGDLSESIVTLKETQFAAGAIIRYNFNQWITLKANIYHGTVSGDDNNSDNFERYHRNLHFKSSVMDISIQPELNLFGYQSGHFTYTSSPYLFIGLSLFRFNPKAEYNGEWVALQPLGTEGQGTTKYNDREKYSLTQISIPIGFGWKQALNRNWNVGIEMGARSTFTDYIDDVSSTYVERDVLTSAHGAISYYLSNRTGEIGERKEYGSETLRGDPTNNDWYYFFGVFITYSILPNPCFRF
jgi:hypothetical protein